MSTLTHITINNFSLDKEIKLDVELSYQLFGKPLHQAPIILVNHALTGNSDVASENGWWKTLVGQQKVIDTTKYTVIAFNIPGNGFDNKKENLIDLYQSYSTKAVAQLFWNALDKLKITQLHALIGGSLGGCIAWEMFFLHPNRVTNLIPVAAHYKSSDWLIANVHIQDRILNNSSQPIQDARMHAMLLYRTPDSLALKFNNQFNEQENQYSVESWLKYHANTLKNRFTLQAYKLMNHLLKTVSQQRTENQILELIRNSKTNIMIISVDSDYMFTANEQRKAAEVLKAANLKVKYAEIQSQHGHDAFLIEYNQLNQLLIDIF